MSTNYYNENLDFLKDRSSFCIYPYIHLEIRNSRTGGLEGSPLCCSANGLHNFAMTEFSNDNIDNNFHMKKFNSIRDRMDRKNNLPENCIQQCPLNKKTTLRTMVNDSYMRSISFKKITEDPTLIRVNWKFGTICNLACRMCQPAVSSHFNKLLLTYEHKDKFEQFNMFANKEVLKTDPKDLEKLKLLLPKLQLLQTSGGEPFLSDDLEELLKTAIKTKDCEHIDLNITTNGTKFIKEKLDIISKFRKIIFTISIDGTDEIYNYIRYPFSFKILKRRLQYLNKYIHERQIEDKFRIDFNPMGMLYNIFNYAKLQDLHDNMFEYTNGGVNVDFNLTGFFTLDNKKHHYHILHLKYAPTPLIEQALTSYQDYQKHRWYRDLEYIYQQKQDNTYNSLVKEFTNTLDDMYRQKYYDYLPQQIVKFLN